MFLRGEQSALKLAGGSANPKIHARTTPDLSISLLMLVLETSLQ